jgi:uncharacterized membrane protein HdeD (DUF308 family)
MRRTEHWPILTSRIAAAILGSYCLAYGFTALVTAVAITTSGDYDEGLLLAYLLAFLVYLAAFLWAFAARSLPIVWLVLGGGGAAMTGIAWSLAQSPGIAN